MTCAACFPSSDEAVVRSELVIANRGALAACQAFLKKEGLPPIEAGMDPRAVIATYRAYAVRKNKSEEKASACLAELQVINAF
jgi:hypothetical protein